MKVLWVVNVPLPEASILLGEAPVPFGGWLIKVAQFLGEAMDIELAVSFPSKKTINYQKLQGESVTYYPFQMTNDKKKNHSLFHSLVKDFNPDIVHIFGTEMSHTIAVVNLCKELKIVSVISIQGLVSIISKHFYAGLPFTAIYGFTLRNLVKKDNVFGLKRIFAKRGNDEIKAIKEVDHIVGRTTWDKACTSQINAEAQYHCWNETLRDEFYRHEWKFENCEKYSIFMSQSHYSIKGLHHIIEALPIIKNKYSNVRLYIAGSDITKNDTLFEKITVSYYAVYIKRLIKKYDLQDNIIFTGSLNEKEMCERYLSANVFICPSSIENSPNSLGEAMLLGVPSVAAGVGGIPDLMIHKEEGFLYHSEAYYMLAYYICEIFEKRDLALYISKNARKRALDTHNQDVNNARIVEIYNEIVGN